MSRALFLKDKKLQIEPIEVRTLGKGEALVKVIKAGICATDINLLKGYYGYNGVLGHEFVGRVTKCNDETWIGKRVVGEINIVCENCVECKDNNKSHCMNRMVLGIKNYEYGAFSEYLVLPIRNLFVVPDNVKDEAAVFCEPLAAVLEIQEQVSFESHQQVLVIGGGKLGQLVARTLALTDSRVWCVARYEAQRKRLSEVQRLEVLSEEDFAKWPKERRFEVVVECTGSPEALDVAKERVRPGKGTLVMKSTYKDKVTVDMSFFVVNEIRLVGSRCGPFGKALQLLEKGFDPSNLISHTFDFDHCVQAFDQATKKGTLKVVIDFWFSSSVQSDAAAVSGPRPPPSLCSRRTDSYHRVRGGVEHTWTSAHLLATART